MTCNDKCIHYPVCEQKKYDFANIDECMYYADERPQGEWIIGYTAKQKKVAVCNLCNCISFQGKTNFCHNCGAAMRKGGAE